MSGDLSLTQKSIEGSQRRNPPGVTAMRDLFLQTGDKKPLNDGRINSIELLNSCLRQEGEERTKISTICSYAVLRQTSLGYQVLNVQLKRRLKNLWKDEWLDISSKLPS